MASRPNVLSRMRDEHDENARYKMMTYKVIPIGTCKCIWRYWLVLGGAGSVSRAFLPVYKHLKGQLDPPLSVT